MFAVYYSLFLLFYCVLGSTTITRWPAGNYGLLKPTTGCPTGWADNGWFLQDTGDYRPNNKRSDILHIEGFVVPSYVLRYFCLKTTTNSTNPGWPEGQYCIYRSGSTTVTGMIWGNIRMHDEIYSNKDTKAYTGNIITIYNRYVDLFFSCQVNGNTKTPIELPITQPFYLLPYGSRDCQQVKWMVATTEWIKYQTRNYDSWPRTYQKSGEVPHHKMGSVGDKGITIYYCYYKSCNYTLTEKTGVFQSPGFPVKYPDGQLCSWRIMVPANHIIKIQFTTFSLHDNDENDKLTFYRNANGVFQLNDTFHGNRVPFTLNATNDVLFDFLTNEKDSNTGFRAEYTIYWSKETTTSNPSTPDSTTIQTIPTTFPLSTTTTAKNQSANETSQETFKKSRVSECDGTGTTIAVVLSLVCLIVVIVIAVFVFYRCRSKETKCKKCEAARISNESAVNPIYDCGSIQIHQRTNTVTMNTTMGEEDNDGQMYQTLSRDQQPEYESPDYSKQNVTVDPNMDPGYPEYHELEPMDNNVPDVVYDVLEGPDPNGTPDDQTYQTLDRKTTDNPLYQSANPATMVTRNRLYVDSVA